MKRFFIVVLSVAFMAAFASCKLDENNGKVVDDPPTGSTTAENTQDPLIPPDDEKIPVDNMGTEEISQTLRGKVFQKGDPYMASGLGEVFCFAPQGNTYYWFCSSMDEQSRVRAEYGTWGLTDGYIVLTTQKLIEWQGGHFAAPSGSAGSRFTLEGFDRVLTEADIESESNFSMFQFPMGDAYEFGFYCIGSDYFYAPGSGGMDYLREIYEECFSLFEKYA